MTFDGVWETTPCGCHSPQCGKQTLYKDNTIIFVIFGYNYRNVPEWYDQYQNKMLSTHYAADTDNLLHEWEFYEKGGPTGMCNKMWYLVTSENVVPQIHEMITGRKMKVQRIARRGYVVWKVTC